MAIKIKNDSHAAWECQNWFLRHLSDENANLKIDQKFVVDRFWWIWGGEKVVKMSEPVRFCIFGKFIRFLKD